MCGESIEPRLEMIRLELPLPPSTNGAYVNRPGKGRARSAKHAAWKREAGWLIKIAKPGKIAGPYRFTILLPIGMRGDISNRVKLAEDLLVELGVTPDDRHAIRSYPVRCADVPAGRCVIEVESAA